MFHLYSVTGRVFSGSAEKLRDMRPTAASARVRRVARVGSDPNEGFGLPTPPPVASDVGRHGALAEYAATEQGASPQRHPLTRVADVMNPQVLTVTADAPVLQVWRDLARHGYGQAPVVDAQGQLVGLFVRAELMRADWLDSAVADGATWRALLAQTVGELMWTPVPAASIDTELRRVAGVLIDTGLPGLPVVDEQGAVTGFVSRSDILRAVAADPPLDLWG